MNALIKKGILAFVLVIGFQYTTTAQLWHYFSGQVVDEVTFSPVPDYPVYLNTTFGDTLNRIVFTNDNGFYLDSVYVDPVSFDYAAIHVDDCFGELQSVFFEPPGHKILPTLKFV